MKTMKKDKKAKLNQKVEICQKVSETPKRVKTKKALQLEMLESEDSLKTSYVTTPSSVRRAREQEVENSFVTSVDSVVVRRQQKELEELREQKKQRAEQTKLMNKQQVHQLHLLKRRSLSNLKSVQVASKSTYSFGKAHPATAFQTLQMNHDLMPQPRQQLQTSMGTRNQKSRLMQRQSQQSLQQPASLSRPRTRQQPMLHIRVQT